MISLLSLCQVPRGPQAGNPEDVSAVDLLEEF